MNSISKKQHGFTIVELLIVIVVIGILAAITIVAYGGIQERARYGTMQQDIGAINKAIQMYHVDNGHYPFYGTTGNSIVATSTGTLAIPGIVPKYMAKMPTIPNDGRSGYYAYIWTAGGGDYKIVRLVPAGGTTLPDVELNDNKMDPYRQRGWGYWSTGGAGI